MEEGQQEEEVVGETRTDLRVQSATTDCRTKVKKRSQAFLRRAYFHDEQHSTVPARSIPSEGPNGLPQEGP